MSIRLLAVVTLGVAVVLAVWWRVVRLDVANGVTSDFGTSFDPLQAERLGLEPRAVFLRMLDDFAFPYVRLSAHWSEVIPSPSTTSFTELDWYMDTAAGRNVKVVLAIGQKTPRWPECHTPEWVRALSPDNYAKAFHDYLTLVVNRYKQHPALEMWQVENEPFLAFGECPLFQPNLVDSAFETVRLHDPVHPRLVTDSGEFSTWRRASALGEFFGTTLYRTVWHRFFGYIRYDYVFSTVWYRLRAWVHAIDPHKAFIIELQAEPWAPEGDLTALSREESDRSMSVTRLQDTAEFARRVGFSRVYIWGVEWWYYMLDIRRDSAVYTAARALFGQSGR